MPFGPTKKLKLNLTAATPTAFDADSLKCQMANIGLNCSQMTQKNLDGFINNVDSQVPHGAVHVYDIKAPESDLKPLKTCQEMSEHMLLKAAPAPQANGLYHLNDATDALVKAATGNWEISPGGDGYGPNLEVIQYQSHFDWLYANKGSNGFVGIQDSPDPFTGYYSNADAIQNLFINVCTDASAVVVKGIDKDAMKAVLSNAIQPLENANISNYDATSSRTIFLVEDYDPNTGIAQGVGAVTVWWHLVIKDYKRKSKDGGDTHDTTLTIKSWSVLYGDPVALCRDYNNVLTQFKIDPNTAPGCDC